MLKNLMKDKQIIHIVAEFVIICGIVYYFNQKNKNLLIYIQNLTQRLDEQEDIIQKHQEVIQQLSDGMHSLSNQIGNISSYVLPQQTNKIQKPQVKSEAKPQAKSQAKSQAKENKPLVHRNPPIQVKEVPKKTKQVLFNTPSSTQNNTENYLQELENLSDSCSESDTSILDDLDNEISEELQELEDLDIEEIDLKKQ